MSKRTQRNNRKPRTGGPSKSSLRMLGILNLLAAQGRYRLFEGVPVKVKAKRRAANKVAKVSRRINRNG